MTDFSPPEAKKILVLSPHPDDESIGCAGTLMLYREKGVEIHLLIASNGEKLETKIENIGELRRKEAINVAKFLGIKNTIFLGLPDESIQEYKKDLKERVKKIIKEIEPDLIFAPFPFDPHPDHKAVSDVALELMRDIRGFKLAFYEIYNPIRFNILVDISEVIDRKKEALFLYQNSLLGIPDLFWYSIKGLNAYRSLVYRRKGYYEAYWLLDSPLSEDDVVNWVSFGNAESAAKIFISKIKETDRLIHELQETYTFLAMKEKEISNLHVIKVEKEILQKEFEKNQKSLNEIYRELHHVKEENEILKSNLELIKKSLFWRFMIIFYKIRDKLLPENTKRRNIYNWIVNNLRKLVK